MSHTAALHTAKIYTNNTSLGRHFLGIRCSSTFWLPTHFFNTDLTHPLVIDVAVSREKNYHDKPENLKQKYKIY